MALSFTPNALFLFCVAISIMFFSPIFTSAENLIDNFEFVWGEDEGKILKGGEMVSLTLDPESGSGFQSRREYQFGKFDMQIKLAPGDTAGTVATYYMTSRGNAHDQIDFEFLGNLSGDPSSLQTNVFGSGFGDREQQFHLWFDPSAEFHTYTILWNPKNIIWYVDGTPIREFRNMESSIGIPYPKSQPMRLLSTIWSAEWATRAGAIQVDWSKAPFTATYRNFNEDACVVEYGQSSCSPNVNNWLYLELDEASRAKMREIQANYMVYNYCTDPNRISQGPRPECTLGAA